eukprot:g18693.t1
MSRDRKPPAAKNNNVRKPAGKATAKSAPARGRGGGSKAKSSSDDKENAPPPQRGKPKSAAAKQPILEEIKGSRGGGYRSFLDKSFGAGKAAAEPLSSSSFQKPRDNADGTNKSFLAQPDVDLPPAATKSLQETGIYEDFVAFPWGTIVAGKQMGQALDGTSCGFPSYLVTFSAPRKRTKKSHCAPADISDAVFLERIVMAHRCYKVTLAKVVIRRERPKGHEHLHAAVTTGEATLRFRWKRISDWLRNQFTMFTNFQYIPFSTAVQYITSGSSRKFQMDFVGEPLLHFSEGNLPETVEELAYNSVLKKELKPMTFLEFRAYVEEHDDIKDVRDLHKHTNNCIRLDMYVNDQRQKPALKLKNAQESIEFRNFEHSNLVKKLLAAADKMPCCCGGKTLPALREWSLGIEWPTVKRDEKPLKKTKTSSAYVILRWARLGRVAGNTMALVGPTGTGKSWVLALIRAALGDEYYEIPKPGGSYPLEDLGWYRPEKFAIVLDECSNERLIAWLGPLAWWKLFLDIQTVRKLFLSLPSNNHFDRRFFEIPSPVCYSSTYPIRLSIGQAGYMDFEKVRAENSQQQRRECVGECKVCVDRGLDKRLPECGHCLSLWLREGNKDYKVIPEDELPKCMQSEKK